MTARGAPAWLAEFQARFGEMIRMPLDRSSGTLAATPALYPQSLVKDVQNGPQTRGEARLAVYNRQYWFRLFEALKSAFPLTSRLTGYWAFNEYAARFFLSHPPRGWDIERSADGFEALFADAIEDEDGRRRQALVEAARIDAGFRRVFLAPKTASYRPSSADATRLLDGRLLPSAALQILEEHSPLLEIRARLVRDEVESRLELPPALARSRWWALVGRDHAILQIPLEAREAELLGLLGAFSIRDALARLEGACSPEERAALPAKTGTWLAQSVERGFWSGIRFGE